jgi:hypothetical protein
MRQQKEGPEHNKQTTVVRALVDKTIQCGGASLKASLRR